MAWWLAGLRCFHAPHSLYSAQAPGAAAQPVAAIPMGTGVYCQLGFKHCSRMDVYYME